MVIFITITTVLHAALFYIDEYILHKRRGLSKSEINSGLIDGILYLVIVALTIFTTFNPTLGYIYISLGVLSCISIIKNEFLYPLDISRHERLIHAGLYVLHPLILYAFYISWEMNFFVTNMNYWMMQLGYLALAVKVVVYHLIYWNYIHEKKYH